MSTKIFVRLLDEGVDVWRPVNAFQLRESVYVIDPDETVPDGERWEFAPGESVVVENQTKSDGSFPIVVKRL